MRLLRARLVLVLLLSLVVLPSLPGYVAQARVARAISARQTKKFNVAYVKEQGVKLVIIPLTASFGKLTLTKMRRAWLALQLCSSKAGFKGTVVPVWETVGQFHYLAPKNWQRFFSSIDMTWVMDRINYWLKCSF